MRQKFMNPHTGDEVGEPMGTERGMRGFGPKKPVMKPGSRPTAHHPHRKGRVPKPPKGGD